jgi:hypothetical protein
MSMQDVLDGVRQVIVATDGMVTGFPGIPEKAPSDDMLPAGLAYFDFERDGTIVHRNEEEWVYPVRVDLLLKREGDFLAELPAAVTLLEAFVAELRKHATLWGAAALVADAVWKPQQLNLFNNHYVGGSWRGSFLALYEVDITA